VIFCPVNQNGIIEEEKLKEIIANNNVTK